MMHMQLSHPVLWPQKDRTIIKPENKPRLFVFERVRGVEPLSSAWKAEVIPIYDTRLWLAPL